MTNGIRYYLYVDSLGVFGLRRNEVANALQQGVDHLDAIQLKTHEHLLSSSCSETLGIEIDGDALSASITSKWYWKLDRGLAWLLPRRRCTGIMLAVFLGHQVYVAMLVLSMLSCFHSRYRFVESHYDEDTELWPSALKELRACKGMLPLLHCS